MPFRLQQYLISAIGSLFLLPFYLFLGGAFSFSFTLVDTGWAWAFGLVACWAQILAVLYSFFNPQRAALWIFVNTAVSMGLAGQHLEQSAQMILSPSTALEQWLTTQDGMFIAGMVFVALPLIFASVLLWNKPDGEDSKT